MVFVKRYGLSICVIYLLCIIFFSSCSQKIRVDMLVHHAVIYTADSSFSVEQAMAVKEGKIVETGTDKDLLDRYEAAEVVDAKGQYIFPGFIDAHCHFTGYATDMWKCDVTGTRSFNEVVDAINKYAAGASTTWLYGRGWDQNDWPEKVFPDKKILDSLFPDRPVFLKRIDGHAALVNQKALDMAHITVASNIAGGFIEVKERKLTGILFDRAMDSVENQIPLIDDQLAVKYFLQAQDSCFQHGITGVHDCGISDHTVALVDAAQQSGKLQMKIFALLSDSARYYDEWIKKGPYKTAALHVGGFKLYADGALGSRGACMLESYSDQPGWKGFLLTGKAEIEKVVTKLAATSFQVCTHAIGDSANRLVLNIYANLLKGHNNRRWRIEHAQVVNTSDFSLFGQYNIIPSVQPTHATSDMYWAEDRLGKLRLEGAYAYKNLLQQNGWMPLGTDFPVEDINPFKTFFAAVARTDSRGFPQGGFQPQNGLNRKEALCGMTIWAAKAAFEEKEKGSLEKNKAADFFISNTDLLKCNASDILHAKVTATFVNGKKVFGR